MYNYLYKFIYYINNVLFPNWCLVSVTMLCVQNVQTSIFCQLGGLPMWKRVKSIQRNLRVALPGRCASSIGMKLEQCGQAKSPRQPK